MKLATSRIGDPRNLSQTAGASVILNQSALDAADLAEIQSGAGNGAALATAGVIALSDGPEPGPLDLLALATFAYMASQAGPLPHVILNENKDTKKKIGGVIETAVEHLEKLRSAPPNDPNRDKWKREIRDALDRAKRLVNRLKGKSAEEIKKEIDSIEKAAQNQPGKQF
jgi:hypothetical protein